MSTPKSGIQNPKIFYLYIYFKMAECREALNMLNQVLEAQPKHIKALYIKGKVLIQTGETEEAIKTLNKSLQLDPANTVIEI